LVGLVLALATSLPGSESASTCRRSRYNSRCSAAGTWRLISIAPSGRRNVGALNQVGAPAIGYLIRQTAHMCVSLANPNHPRWGESEKPTEAQRLHSCDVLFGLLRGGMKCRQKAPRVIHRRRWPLGSILWTPTSFGRIRMEGDRLISSERKTPARRRTAELPDHMGTLQKNRASEFQAQMGAMKSSMTKVSLLVRACCLASASSPLRAKEVLQERATKTVKGFTIHARVKRSLPAMWLFHEWWGSRLGQRTGLEVSGIRDTPLWQSTYRGKVATIPAWRNARMRGVRRSRCET